MEIEVKYCLSGRDESEFYCDKLRKLGADDLGAVLEENLYFDWPDGRLRVSDSGLRIRLKTPLDGLADGRPLVTFKGPRKPGLIKIRSEVEFKCDDAESCEQLFDGLGMSRIMSFQKRRHSFGLDRCVIEIDELPQLGFFMEIEGPSEDEVVKMASVIGADSLEQEHRSYARMVDISMDDGTNELKF